MILFWLKIEQNRPNFAKVKKLYKIYMYIKKSYENLNRICNFKMKLDSLSIHPTISVQTLNKVVCISLHANALGKIMNPCLLTGSIKMHRYLTSSMVNSIPTRSPKRKRQKLLASNGNLNGKSSDIHSCK